MAPGDITTNGLTLGFAATKQTRLHRCKAGQPLRQRHKRVVLPNDFNSLRLKSDHRCGRADLRQRKARSVALMRIKRGSTLTNKHPAGAAKSLQPTGLMQTPSFLSAETVKKNPQVHFPTASRLTWSAGPGATEMACAWTGTASESETVSKNAKSKIIIMVQTFRKGCCQKTPSTQNPFTRSRNGTSRSSKRAGNDPALDHWPTWPSVTCRSFAVPGASATVPRPDLASGFRSGNISNSSLRWALPSAPRAASSL